MRTLISRTTTRDRAMTDPQSRKKPKVAQILSTIVAGLIAGFDTYVSTWRSTIVHRAHWAQRAPAGAPPNGMGASISVFLGGAAISYVLYLPIMLYHDIKYPGLLYLFQIIYLQGLSALTLHVALKLVMGKGLMGQTIAVWCTWAGLVAPLGMIISLPMFIYLPIEDMIDYGSSGVGAVPFWVLISVAAGFLGLAFPLFLIAFRWLAFLHQIKPGRVFLAFLLFQFPLVALSRGLLDPVVNRALKWTSTFIDRLL